MKRKAFACILIFSILVLLCGLSFSCSDFLNDYYDLTPELLSLYVSGDDSVAVGSTINLSVKAVPNNSNSDVIWSSSNSSIATVDSSGEVTGVASGTVSIIATSVENAEIYDS